MQNFHEKSQKLFGKSRGKLFFCFLHFPNLAVTEGICFYAIFYKNFEQFLVENFWKSFEYILLRMLQQAASILIFLAIPL